MITDVNRIIFSSRIYENNNRKKCLIFSQNKKRFEKIVNKQIIVKVLYYRFLFLFIIIIYFILN